MSHKTKSFINRRREFLPFEVCDVACNRRVVRGCISRGPRSSLFISSMSKQYLLLYIAVIALSNSSIRFLAFFSGVNCVLIGWRFSLLSFLPPFKIGKCGLTPVALLARPLVPILLPPRFNRHDIQFCFDFGSAFIFPTFSLMTHPHRYP